MSTPLSFIDVDISQRILAISLPFTDCALNEATMNGCIFSSFFHLDMNDDGVEDMSNVYILETIDSGIAK